MPDSPHYSWPLAFETQQDGTITFGQVEEGSDAELEASAAVIISTPRGHRDDDPTFGVSPLVFQGGVDTDRLADELQQADPRLSVEADEVVALIEPWVSVVRAHIDGQEG